MKQNDISSNVLRMQDYERKKKPSSTHSHYRMLYNNNIPRDTFGSFYQASAGEDEQHMDWQEKYFDKLEQDIKRIEESFKHTEQHISQIINQALGEMRDRDNQRHNEMAEIRQMLSEEKRWIKGIAITVILGVAAMAITVLMN